MIVEGGYFTIRRIDEGSLNAVLEVYKQCEDFLSLGPVAHASAQMVLDDFALSREEGGTFCGIFVNGEMVGIVDFVSQDYDSNPEEAYLALLMIGKSQRRRGLGQQVVQAVEAEILKNSNIQTIRAGVQVNNTPAIAFWQKLGYQIISGPTLLPDKTTVYGLKKEIVAS